MRPTGIATEFALGFCTIVDQGDGGLVGGYLLLDKRGRPLEFHCTAPVQPNRAQQILFGPTLRTYLCGEQIAMTLWRHSKIKTALQLTDVADVAAARSEWTGPVVLVGKAGSADPASTLSEGMKEPPFWMDLGVLPTWHPVDLCPNSGAVMPGFAGEIAQIEQIANQRGDWDLLEPFQRIRDALEEALGRQAA